MIAVALLSKLFELGSSPAPPCHLRDKPEYPYQSSEAPPEVPLDEARVDRESPIFNSGLISAQCGEPCDCQYRMDSDAWHTWTAGWREGHEPRRSRG